MIIADQEYLPIVSRQSASEHRCLETAGTDCHRKPQVGLLDRQPLAKDAAIGRQHECGLAAKLLQGHGQGARHVRQSTGFGKRHRLAGNLQHTHRAAVLSP